MCSGGRYIFWGSTKGTCWTLNLPVQIPFVPAILFGCNDDCHPYYPTDTENIDVSYNPFAFQDVSQLLLNLHKCSIYTQSILLIVR